MCRSRRRRSWPAQLTLAGLEVESVTPVAPPFTGVVVGEVLESGRHPDAENCRCAR
jgi:phenylalanyl-tRNA synthetase beta chain